MFTKYQVATSILKINYCHFKIGFKKNLKNIKKNPRFEGMRQEFRQER